MDLRYPFHTEVDGFERDSSNIKCAAALEKAFPRVEFDAENAKFLARVPELDIALLVVAVAQNWM